MVYDVVRQEKKDRSKKAMLDRRSEGRRRAWVVWYDGGRLDEILVQIRIKRGLL